MNAPAQGVVNVAAASVDASHAALAAQRHELVCRIGVLHVGIVAVIEHFLHLIAGYFDGGRGG